MYVIKRDGTRQKMSFDQINDRLVDLATNPEPLDVDICRILFSVIQNIVTDIHTSKLDDIAADVCAQMSTLENQYDVLATRIAVSNLYKSTAPTFSGMIGNLRDTGLINPEISALVEQHAAEIDAMIMNSRDTLFDYFGIRTLCKSYLLVHKGKVVERPQYMWMRTALELHREDMQRVRETYDLLSQHYYTHATPTLFNSCLAKNQLSSCMLLTNKSDSVDGIYDTLRECSVLGASAAGIGLAVTSIRAAGSIIKSTSRPSRGVTSFLMVHDLNSTVIDQGGKRNMSEAVYIEPWHADFMEVIDMRANDDLSPIRGRELFYAVWMNTLLQTRAERGEMWSMFCPTDTPELIKLYGPEFNAAYELAESRGLARKTIPARDVLIRLAELMIETGQPYVLNKDMCNAKSNMKNVGTINCSNLCAEILIPSGSLPVSDDVKSEPEYQIGVCTLASINLTRFVTRKAELDMSGEIVEPGVYDFDGLRDLAAKVARNLDTVIDRQLYPLEPGRVSSLAHRPIGVGVQGLANVFMLMGFPYESDEARSLNYWISEEIYRGCINASMELAKEHGPYATFPGSPASEGRLQPQLWWENGWDDTSTVEPRYNWPAIGRQVAATGLRNALLVAYMPTASTSQILGNYSSFEPAIANIFMRHTLAGNFPVVNQHLIAVLERLGMWNAHMRDTIIAHEGSIQSILEIPERFREIYKTAWEMRTSRLMQMSADRGQFICHTQSHNIFVPAPTIKQVTAIIGHGCRLGLKTITYYTRSRPAREAVKFTISRELETSGPSGSPAERNAAETTGAALEPATTARKSAVCTDDVCVSCSS